VNIEFVTFILKPVTEGIIDVFLVKIPNKLVKHLFIISPHKVPVTICNTLKKI